jgi:hypothetical protein
MKDPMFKLVLVAIVVLEAIIILSLPTCRRNETKTVTTNKQGKTELVKSTKTITFDTLRWIATYKANTKPVIKWLKPKATHDTTERQLNYVYSPCDSIFNSLDTGTIEGVKFAIVDTIIDNRIKGRSIKLQVPQTQITKQITIVNDSLRVDTVYINQKQKFGTNAKWFFKGFIVGGALGFGGGVFVPR